MLQDRIAKRYAASIFVLAVEKKQLQAIADDFNLIGKMLGTNRDFLLFLKSPIINIEKKKAVLKALFSGKVHTTTETFLDILVRKGRENVLEFVVREFTELFNRHQNQQKAVITAAQPLAAETIATIRQQLERRFNSTILIETKINPDLIGGFVVRVGDILYDASISSRVRALRKRFSENLYIVKF